MSTHMASKLDRIKPFIAILATAAMAQTHHLASLYADLPHAIISLLSFALL